MFGELFPGEGDVNEFHRILFRGRGAANELNEKLGVIGANEICIVVDQFEELFRYARESDVAEAQVFADVLIELTGLDPDDTDPEFGGSGGPDGSRIWAIATMRSEFLGECARFAGLAQVVNRTQYLLPDMSEADLRRAIREPAALVGGSVSMELADQLVSDVNDDGDPLPLVQHALMQLWERNRPCLCLSDYFEELDKLRPLADERGRTGISMMLAGHANSVLQSVAEAGREECEKTAEFLFRR